MNVTKTQLRDFVDGKIAERKVALYEEIKVTVTERLGDSLKILLGDIKELERVASKFEDLLTEKIHLIGAKSVPNYASITASNANRLCKSHKYFLDELVPNALNALLKDKYYLFESDALMESFNALNAELQPKIKLYRDGLDTLKRELNNAVSNETTGKRAHTVLVALGVDMSDLPEANPNLPTVIKLSVDVCAINGNC
jgi:hypothetical protein